MHLLTFIQHKRENTIMKNIVLITAASCLMSGAVFAGGNMDSTTAPMVSPYYVNVHGGLSIANNDNIKLTLDPNTYDVSNYNTGYTLGGAVGYDFRPFRAEFALDYIYNSRSANDNVYTSLTTYMVNGYYDIDLGYRFKPYVGAGLGAATAHVGYSDDNLSSYAKDTQFAYKGIAGVAYQINDRLSTNLEYNYLGTSDFDFQGTSMSYGTNLITLGLSYRI